MFDATEAVDALIEELAQSKAQAKYNKVYEELCYRVESGEISAEQAESVNQLAYAKYFGESTPSDMGTSAADKALQSVNRDSHKSAIGHQNIDNSQANGGTASTKRTDDVEKEGIKKLRKFDPKNQVIPNPK